MLTIYLGVMNNDSSSENAPALGTDGTVEDNGSIPPRLSTGRSDASLRNPHVTKPVSVSPSTVSQSEALEKEYRTVDEEDDIEHENTRRKRRRISTEPEQRPLETHVGQHTTQTTWHDHLDEAARMFQEGDPQRQGIIAENPVNQPAFRKAEELNDLLRPLRSTQAESRSMTSGFTVQYPTVISSPSHDIDSAQCSKNKPSVSDTTANNSLSQPNTEISTPKKKTLLNGNGKSTHSPTQSPRRSPRTKNTLVEQQGRQVKKMATMSKKIEMKNGKFVSSLRVTLPYSAPNSGAKIDEILSGSAKTSRTLASQTETAPSALTGSKATHPFFLGNLALKTQKQAEMKSEASSTALASEDEASGSVQASKPWKDIIFGSRKPFQNKAAIGIPVIWPPSSIQHVQPDQRRQMPLVVQPPISSTTKAKHHASHVNADEDILRRFSYNLKNMTNQSPPMKLPTRRVMSGKEMARELDLVERSTSDSPSPQSSNASLRSRIKFTPSAFDKGMAAGPQMWPQEYAPKCWQEVLQPQTKILHDWLSNLKVHQVQSGKLKQNAKLPTPKKPRRKRKSDEMDDFIENSDEEGDNAHRGGKNSILLTGPPGSGKTASVFAVAQQLGFEIFEIHPGMRRNAKDIQDKVGDMTQNHLVQQADTLSRRSSVSIDDADSSRRPSPSPQPIQASQKTMAQFMGLDKRGKQQQQNGNHAPAKDTKEGKVRSQKQSLILFEEADILFDDDKGFWSGVQSLIKTSKRPVILTCNDLESVPLEELDLFAVLTYEKPEPESAVNHLSCIAAAEGHLLSKETLRNVYIGKGRDLRASITELNLWCQMTVGSQQGGLDWMLPHEERCKFSPDDGSITRIVSQDTFTSGLDLFPTVLKDYEDLVRFAHDSLDISPLDWVENDSCSSAASRLRSLDDNLLLSDARSAMDLFDTTTSALLTSSIKKISSKSRPPAVSSLRADVLDLYLSRLTPSTSHPTRSSIISALCPLSSDTRIGLPLIPGRKSPSLDSSAISIVTEIAPYVRCIISHDQRLEQLRNELYSADGEVGRAAKRQRRTRASRAALDGGTKANTRRDRWFPEGLNWVEVLGTGGSWPQPRTDDLGIEGGSSLAATPTPTPSQSPDPSMAPDRVVGE